jgi:hypothetical protein
MRALWIVALMRPAQMFLQKEALRPVIDSRFVDALFRGATWMTPPYRQLHFALMAALH